MLKFLERASNNIDRLTNKANELTSWIILLMILFQFTALLLKNIYGLKVSGVIENNGLTLALLISAACAQALIINKHLRIDVFIKKRSPKKQAIINLIGGLVFVIPTAALIFGLSWQYFLSEFHKHQLLITQDTVSDPSSLKPISLIVYIILIMIFTQLTALGGISMASKALLTWQQSKSNTSANSGTITGEG